MEINTMTKARKKLQEAIQNHGSEAVSDSTGICRAALYNYVGSQEKTMKMSVERCLKLSEYLGVNMANLREWWEEV